MNYTSDAVAEPKLVSSSRCWPSFGNHAIPQHGSSGAPTGPGSGIAFECLTLAVDSPLLFQAVHPNVTFKLFWFTISHLRSKRWDM